MGQTIWTTAARIGWLASASLALALCGAAQAQDDPPGRVGRIGELHGEVSVFDAEQGDWVAAVRNRPFTQGDRLSTADAGRVELNIGSTTLLLGSGAELEALRLDDDSIQLQLHRGSLALRLRSQEVAGELQVFTGEGRVAFQRSGLYRVNRHDETSSASVWRGDLSFQTDDFLLPLQTGQAAEFWRDGPQRTTRSRWLTPQNDDFALLVLQQDQAAERSVSAQYVSPEMTGIEDLDRHGRWQQHPDYGAIWTPTVVSVGWAPYRHGHWAWVRPWGWTWVDDAAWGFAPFHYGRWLWWGSRWCWTPGPRVRRPVYAPALVGWVGGGHAPFTVNVGGRAVPAVGWVPLAPREAYRPGYRSSPGYLDRINVGRPHPHGPAPAFGNRTVPGAVTLLPAQSMQPRHPVAGSVLRGDTTRLPSQRFNPVAPGRPAAAAREQVSPRQSAPLTAMPRQPSARPPAPGVETVVAPQREGTNRPFRPNGDAAQLPAVPRQPAAPPAAALQQPQPSPPPMPTPTPMYGNAKPVAPAHQAGGEARESHPGQRGNRPPMPNGTAVAAPQAPQRPFQPQAPQRPLQPPAAIAPAMPAPAAAAVAVPPPAVMRPPPPAAVRPPPPVAVRSPPVPAPQPTAAAQRPVTPAVAPAVAAPARVDNAGTRANARENSADKPGQPTMRTPQSRYPVRER